MEVAALTRAARRATLALLVAASVLTARASEQALPPHIVEWQRVQSQLTTRVITLPRTHSNTEDDDPNVAVCAGSRLGTRERWRVVLTANSDDDNIIDDDNINDNDSADAHTLTLANRHRPIAMFMSLTSDVQTVDAPCIAARDILERLMHQHRDSDQFVRMESMDGTFTLKSATPRIIVRNGLSLPLDTSKLDDAIDLDDDSDSDSHLEHPVEAAPLQSQTQLQNQQDNPPQSSTSRFAFASALDVLTGVAARDSYSPLAESQRALYAAEFTSADGAVDLDELLRDLAELVLQAERELVSAAPLLADTWTRAFSLERWATLRQTTDTNERKAIAADWTTLAKLELARSSGDIATSVNYLRRAVEWSPSTVAPYLTLATLLTHVHDTMGTDDSSSSGASASCEVMELLLVRADTSELRATGSLAALLTRHFAHCSVMIRVASLWDASALFRYAVGASVVVSVAHAVWIALACCRDFAPTATAAARTRSWRQWLCRRDLTSTSARLTASSSSSSSKRSKRE